MPKLPRKQEGDTLSAKHVNTLSRSAEHVLGPGMGMFGSQFGGKFSGLPPHVQRVAIITDDAEDPIFSFRLRYFDPDDTTDTEEGSWKTDEDSGPYFVDANALGSSLAVDDKIIVWWDQQRGMYVPAGGGGGGGNIIVDIDPDSVDMDCGCYKATATVIRALCSGGPAVGDEIDVYDDMGCHLNVPADEMPTRFMASKTKGDAYLGEDPLPYGCDDPYDDPQACHWTLFDPCCDDE